MVKRIAVLLSGNGSNLQALIDHQDQMHGQIDLVISNKASAYGLVRAKEAGINTEVIIRDDAKILQLCKQKKIDIIVLAGYLAFVTPTLLQAYENKIVNIHPSLIPSFCGPGAYGMHVHEKVIARGVKVTGATVHFVSDEVDGGPIIMQKACDISDLHVPEEVQQRVLVIEHEILVKSVAALCQDQIEIEEGRVIIHE